MCMELSDNAKNARRDYYRERYQADPVRHRQYNLNTWERKAREIFGADYIPPTDRTVLSDQASQLRRQYYAEYRQAHNVDRSEYMRHYRESNKERLAEHTRNYWERKGKEGKKK